MRTLLKAAIALSFISAAAIGTTATVQAQGVYFDAPGVHVGVGSVPSPLLQLLWWRIVQRLPTGLDGAGRCL